MIIKDKEQLFFRIGTLLLVWVPPVLMYYWVMGDSYRTSRFLLWVVFLIYLYLTHKKQLTWHELWWRKDMLAKWIIPYTIFTAFWIWAFLLIFEADISVWWAWVDVLWVFVVGNMIGSFIQQFVIHWYLSNFLEKYTNWYIAEYMIAWFLFTRIHLPLVEYWETLAITFPFFVIRYAVWKAYPNIYLATISHCILNLLVTGLGLFSVFG